MILDDEMIGSMNRGLTMRKIPKKIPPPPPGAPSWMITYGDMMSLLLCFFILLFSFSNLDVKKFREVIIEFQGSLGVLTGGPMVLNLGDIPQEVVIPDLSFEPSRMQSIKKAVEDKVEEAGFKDSVETVRDERGLMIRFTDTALFDIGKAEVKPDVFPILKAITEELRDIPNEVRVEGHTDPTPIRTAEFSSNWELSVHRATAVVHFLIEQGGISPDRLQAAGYAFYNPVVPNTTPENRAKNRRVDVIILNSEDETRAENRMETLGFLEGPDSDGVVFTSEEEDSQMGLNFKQHEEPVSESTVIGEEVIDGDL